MLALGAAAATASSRTVVRILAQRFLDLASELFILAEVDIPVRIDPDEGIGQLHILDLNGLAVQGEADISLKYG